MAIRSKEERERLTKIALERHKNGEMFRVIAKDMGISKSSLSGWINRKSPELVAKKAPKPELSKPVEFSAAQKKKGMTVIAIGDETHVSLALEAIAQIIGGST